MHREYSENILNNCCDGTTSTARLLRRLIVRVLGLCVSMQRIARMRAVWCIPSHPTSPAYRNTQWAVYCSSNSHWARQRPDRNAQTAVDAGRQQYPNALLQVANRPNYYPNTLLYARIDASRLCKLILHTFIRCNTQILLYVYDNIVATLKRQIG